MVSHGHIRVNGKKINIPSYMVKEGDEISVVDSMQENINVTTAITSTERDIPDYYEIDAKGLKGKFIRIPKLSDVPYPVQMEPNLVVEFYSR